MTLTMSVSKPTTFLAKSTMYFATSTRASTSFPKASPIAFAYVPIPSISSVKTFKHDVTNFPKPIPIASA